MSKDWTVEGPDEKGRVVVTLFPRPIDVHFQIHQSEVCYSHTTSTAESTREFLEEDERRDEGVDDATILQARDRAYEHLEQVYQKGKKHSPYVTIREARDRQEECPS